MNKDMKYVQDYYKKNNVEIKMISQSPCFIEILGIKEEPFEENSGTIGYIIKACLHSIICMIFKHEYNDNICEFCGKKRNINYTTTTINSEDFLK